LKRIVGFVAISLFALPLQAPPAAAASDGPWCPAPAPCIVSATRNSVTVDESNGTWDVVLSHTTAGGSNDILWGVQKEGAPDPYELEASSLSDVWVITIDVGTIVPRVVFTHGDNVAVARTGSQVTVTANPTTITGECDQSVWPWTCPVTATQQWDGYLDGQITDYGVWDNAAQRNAMFGMNYATNISATSMPPEIVNDPATGEEQLLIRLANPHFEEDGTTVFTGFAHLRIPNSFLKKAYGIDDPSSLTGRGLAPSVGGPTAGSGTVTVAQESGGGAVLVDIVGVTFSHRLVRIRRGVITPKKPKDLRATRSGGSGATLRFDPATSRGSRIKRYEGLCTQGSDVAVDKGRRSPLRVAGLGGGSYTCRVRAISKAGPGKWSGKDRIGG
jgi:hypothetical protein